MKNVFLVALTGLSLAFAHHDSQLQGIRDLVARRIPGHEHEFEFHLTEDVPAAYTRFHLPKKDSYVVSEGRHGGSVRVEGSSINALARGVHHYMTDILHYDVHWFAETPRSAVPWRLPRLHQNLTGDSTVQWRYNFNTVTFSYTMAYWTWEDWEEQLDWAALHGVNVQLAWVGYEKIYHDALTEFGLLSEDVLAFFSGPSYQSWNRFGNIHGSWTGAMPFGWLESQQELQKKILPRMIELGITPALPAFPGFVPNAIKEVRPNVTLIHAGRWSGTDPQFTNDAFIQPTDPAYAELQELFMEKQIEAYGNITHVWTLDQYNELHPPSGELATLRDLASHTWKSLINVDNDAIWLLQGWFFYSSQSFWTDSRVEAYLSGIEDNNAILILDLYSEARPQWERTKGYYGKPWIWCQLHDFGGNMALYGRISNITEGPVAALEASSSMAGMGLTPEGLEGNEIMYSLLLDQAWSKSVIDTKQYFHSWTTSRYAGCGKIPQQLYQAWEILRTTAYDNKDPDVPCVYHSIFELNPAISGLTDRVDHYPTPTKLYYDPRELRKAWHLMLQAAKRTRSLRDIPAFQLDLVDVTRQVMGNAFIDVYEDYVSAYKNNNTDASKLKSKGQKLINFLQAIDSVLATQKHFTLDNWTDAARAQGAIAGFGDQFAMDARDQVTLWDNIGVLTDYASKAWSGLIKGYYVPRWQMFIDYTMETPVEKYSQKELNAKVRVFERSWIKGDAQGEKKRGEAKGVVDVVERVREEWAELLDV